MQLNLGVLDVAYSDAANGGKETSTGDVAAILEKNYAVMGTFFELYKDKIAQWLADDMAASLQTLVNSGGRIDTSGRTGTASHKVAGMSAKRVVSGDQLGTLTYGADQKIENAFRTFLFAGEMKRISGGANLSAAAQAGKTKRTKSGFTKGKKARPDFVDTGLYASAFRAWTTS
jgi:hypothetical protein